MVRTLGVGMAYPMYLKLHVRDIPIGAALTRTEDPESAVLPEWPPDPANDKLRLCEMGEYHSAPL